MSFTRLNSRLVSRGPDGTKVIRGENWWLSHNLLSLTGDFIQQPYLDKENNIIVVFNGEIYNWNKLVPESKSEAEAIAKLYDLEGYYFSRYLDGEFSCLIIDLKYNELIVATDPFGTKPLYYYIDENKAVFSSLPSPVEAVFKRSYKYSPNTIRKTSLKYLDESSFYFLGSSCEWSRPSSNIFNQDLWQKLFLEAISKRILSHQNPDEFFLPLSSGLDSGCIFAACIQLNLKPTIISLLGREDDLVINNRLKLAKDNNMKIITIPYDSKNLSNIINYLKTKVDQSKYKNYSNSSNYNEMGIGKEGRSISLVNDNGARGIAVIGKEACKNQFKICISGSGADEIMSDYGHQGMAFAGHSSFSGNWPENMKRAFPWPSFYGSSMETYLMKEEHILGSFGIETRYPFLDKSLNNYLLTCERNSFTNAYKKPLAKYLSSRCIPFHSRKIGF